jgi:beta-1,4-mannosyl-glycoprotein beta-1,4-N-acetylglucosaminyltransferase
VITAPVFDCFPYFNEVELLELRIKTLQDHVSGFIITESDHTFNGEPKPYTCLDQLQQMGLLSHKIQVIHVTAPSAAENPDPWYRERLQRDAAVKSFQPGNIYIVSDCDEIIDPHMIPAFVQGTINHPNHILRINMAWLMCRADLRVVCPRGIPSEFNHAFVCTTDHVARHSLSRIREDHACQLHSISFPSLYMLDDMQKKIECGWHISWMGSIDRIKTKMRSYSHHSDAQAGIFQTAVGAINSVEMQRYLDSYVPADGSSDPYGRSDYQLGTYDRALLPKTLLDTPHLRSFFLGESI